MSTTGEDFSHQSSYIFTPHSNADDATRSSKRRKLSKGKEVARKDLKSKTLFVPLLNGNENVDCVQRRHDSFCKLWAETDERIQVILSEANENTLSQVTEFVKSTELVVDEDMIPTGLIVTGPNISSQSSLFDRLAVRLRSEIKGPVVAFRSGEASNIKTILKKLNREVTEQIMDDEDADILTKQGGQKLLNYDLQVLQDYVEQYKSEKVVVAFQDTEAFSSGLLTELILVFHAWLDRIPFVLLFGIATSVELFSDRLSGIATRYIRGAQFDVEQTSITLEKVFQDAVASPNAKLRLGSSVVSMLIERQNDHLQSVQAFIVALKYAYMCHFYTNPLSILTDATTFDRKSLQPEHFEIIRSLPSFRTKVNEMVENREAGEAWSLLEDDDALFEEVLKNFDLTQGLLRLLLRSIYLLGCASTEVLDPMDLYVGAFDGTLRDSNIFKNVIDSIKRLSITGISSLADKLAKDVRQKCTKFIFGNYANDVETMIAKFESIKSAAIALEAESKKLSKPLRSKYSTQKTLRTTVIAQKVQLSTEALAVTEQDKAFSGLIDRLIDIMEDLPFDNPEELFLHELWLYDIRSPHREVFTPRPRFAIEKALSNPHHYLNCACCDPKNEGLAPYQPATAILYQLYLEGGSMINVENLWTAFLTIVGKEEADDGDERKMLVQFYRALAELKAAGMVKNSRKKTDHLAKLTWRGL